MNELFVFAMGVCFGWLTFICGILWWLTRSCPLIKNSAQRVKRKVKA